MKNSKSPKDIREQVHTMLSNISNVGAAKKCAALRAQGSVPLSEADQKGFTKLAWDMYQKKAEPDAGSIWTVADIDGEKWLVCYTDTNARIMRNLAKEYLEGPAKIAKTSSLTADASIFFNAGDLVEISPRHHESINNKYKGKRAYVSASMPDRSQLSFEDGSAIWVENRDLALVKDARELAVGDDVRMFSRQHVEGKVTKLSTEYVEFENEVGQKFSARIKDIVKAGPAAMFYWGDPKGLKYIPNTQGGGMPEAGAPEDEAEPGAEGLTNATEPLAGAGKALPSIKPEPTPQEMAAGTAVPASNRIAARARTMHMGDEVRKKSTGESGTILEIGFDRKLGKFYRVNFGQQNVRVEYETDLMKTNMGKLDSGKAPEMSQPGALPVEGLPMRASKEPWAKYAIEIDPTNQALQSLIETATQAVTNVVADAQDKYMAAHPGQAMPSEDYRMILWNVLTGWFKNYLPEEFQGISGIEKDAAMGAAYRQLVESVPPDAGGADVLAHVRKHVRLAVHENDPRLQGLEDMLISRLFAQVDLLQPTLQAEDVEQFEKERAINDIRDKIPPFVQNVVAHSVPQDMGVDAQREYTVYLITKILRAFDKALTTVMAPKEESKILPREALPIPGQQFDLPSNMPEGIAAKLLREKLAALKPLRTKAAFDNIEAEKKFFTETANILAHNGFDHTVAGLISKNLTSIGTIDNAILRRYLITRLGFAPFVVQQMVDAASDLVGDREVKVAQGLPGMESLRGGGGGYPGGSEVEPMSWTVKNPQEGAGPNTEDLESALQENLQNESVPFEEGAEPKKVDVQLDMDNKKITINFGQGEKPPIELNPAEAPVEQPQAPGPGQTMPGAPGPAAGPGQSQPSGQETGGKSDFDNQNIPVNF